jgi:hypothetical protein
MGSKRRRRVRRKEIMGGAEDGEWEYKKEER